MRTCTLLPYATRFLVPVWSVELCRTGVKAGRCAAAVRKHPGQGVADLHSDLDGRGRAGVRRVQAPDAPATPELKITRPPCGSEPARDIGGTFNTDVPDRSLSRAGSPPN